MYHSQTLSALNKHRISCTRYKIYKQNSGGNQMSVYQRRNDRARHSTRADRSGAEPSEGSGAEWSVATQTSLLCCRSNATEPNRIKLGDALLRYVENNNSERLRVAAISVGFTRRWQGSTLMEIQPMIICFLHH